MIYHYAWFNPMDLDDWDERDDLHVSNFDEDRKILRNGEDGWSMLIEHEHWFVGMDVTKDRFIFEWRTDE